MNDALSIKSPSSFFFDRSDSNGITRRINDKRNILLSAVGEKIPKTCNVLHQLGVVLRCRNNLSRLRIFNGLAQGNPPIEMRGSAKCFLHRRPPAGLLLENSKSLLKCFGAHIKSQHMVHSMI